MMGPLVVPMDIPLCPMIADDALHNTRLHRWWKETILPWTIGDRRDIEHRRDRYGPKFLIQRQSREKAFIQ
jgi:hypothetical protein